VLVIDTVPSEAYCAQVWTLTFVNL